MLSAAETRQLRHFGLVMAGAFTTLGAIRSLVRWEFEPVLFVVAAAFAVTALVYAPVLRPVFWAWMKLGLAINWVMTRVFLSLAFFLLITPARFIIAVAGKDPLNRRWDPSADSYWEDPEEHPDELERYRKQF